MGERVMSHGGRRPLARAVAGEAGKRWHLDGCTPDVAYTGVTNQGPTGKRPLVDDVTPDLFARGQNSSSKRIVAYNILNF